MQATNVTKCVDRFGKINLSLVSCWCNDLSIVVELEVVVRFFLVH